LGTAVPYIGLLGPRDRREEILKQMEPSQRTRLYGPVGLDLGGEGAEQVALSIVAEILAVRAGRAPGHLRDRPLAIHAR
jgi:xanthine/CO dehydrogenase XdhC/CoxF family maturation factor